MITLLLNRYRDKDKEALFEVLSTAQSELMNHYCQKENGQMCSKCYYKQTCRDLTTTINYLDGIVK